MPLELPRLSARASITQDAPGKPALQPHYDYIKLFNDMIGQLESQFDTIFSMLAAISWPIEITITASASGATATIEVSAHTRVYLNLAIPISAGSVTGLAYATTYWLYYDDPDRQGGDVAYFATTSQVDAFASPENPNRHFVGFVTTPATDADPPTTGTPALPPGDQGVSTQDPV